MILHKEMRKTALKKLFVFFGIAISSSLISVSFSSKINKLWFSLNETNSINLAIFFIIYTLTTLWGYLKMKEFIQSSKLSFFKFSGFSKKSILLTTLVPIAIGTLFFFLYSEIFNFFCSNLSVLDIFCILNNLFCIQFILIFLRGIIKRPLWNIGKILIIASYMHILLNVNYHELTYNGKAVYFIGKLLSNIGKSQIIRFILYPPFEFTLLLFAFSFLLVLLINFSKLYSSFVDPTRYSNYSNKKIMFCKLRCFLLSQNKYTAQLIKDLRYYIKTISFILYFSINIVAVVLSVKVIPFNYNFFIILIFSLSWINPTMISDLYSFDINSKVIYKLMGLQNKDIIKLKAFNGFVLSIVPIVLILSMALILGNISLPIYLLALILTAVYIFLGCFIYSLAITLYFPSWNNLIGLLPLSGLNFIPFLAPLTFLFLVFKFRKGEKNACSKQHL